MPAGKIIIYIVGFSMLKFPVFRKIASCIYQVNIKRAEGDRSASEDIYYKKGAEEEERRGAGSVNPTLQSPKQFHQTILVD